ncbi:MAG: hypothetical protein M3Y71_18520 [Actinomycetota bacterium]|nr:hypothetical protein [Actinomycetota bacterium]
MEITHVEDDAPVREGSGEQRGQPRDLWLNLSSPLTDAAQVLTLTGELDSGHLMRAELTPANGIGRLVVEKVAPDDDQRVLALVRKVLDDLD